MTVSETSNAEERKRARLHKVARRLYEALVAQDPDRVITLRDGRGKVVARPYWTKILEQMSTIVGYVPRMFGLEEPSSGGN